MDKKFQKKTGFTDVKKDALVHSKTQKSDRSKRRPIKENIWVYRKSFVWIDSSTPQVFP